MLKKVAMNELKLAIMLSLTAIPLTNSHATALNVDSTIKAVTVYPGSAKITRVSDVNLTTGLNEVVIKNLPVNLIESSLRVTGEGQGSISLGSVQLSRDIQQDVVQEQEKNILLKIEEAQENKKIIQDSIDRSKSQLEYIKKMVLGNSTISRRKDEGQNGSYMNLPLEQWQEAWKTLDDATKKVQEDIRASERKLKISDKLINKLKRELKLVATNQKAYRTAKLTIDADSESLLNLNLTYQINGARWEPVYDIDLNTESGEIEMKTLAQISQRTGENWNNVNVTLSTLRPSAGTQLPNLNPWVLDFIPERLEAEISAYSSGMVMESSKAIEAPSPVPTLAAKPALKRKSVAMRQQQSRLISADFSAEYKVPSTITLGSGSDKRRFSLNTNTLASAIKLASSPRYDARVMILATTKYEEETPLLAGSMSLYRNGNYVGNSFLQQKQSGEEIRLSFGEDDKVKIKFMPDPDKKRKDGLLFGKKKVVERHYKVSINSNHSKGYPISISDVIPVASDENIKVKRLGELPTVTDVDDKKGVVSWNKTLKPKSELKIKYGYSVSFPEDKNIQNL